LQGTTSLGCVTVELVPILRLSRLRKRKTSNGESERGEKQTELHRRVVN